ncbi:MAG: radical SAM protein [Thermodesulfobacteriota bacterium]
MKPYRVLFIKPPDSDVNVLSLDVPLGILYLSACLKKNFGDLVRTDIIDLRLEQEVEAPLTAKIREFPPDLIGISLLAFNKLFIKRYISLIKALAPAAKIVIGGPDATYSYQEFLRQYPGIDFAVIGEGERVFTNLVRMLMTGGEAGSVKGIAFRKDDQILVNEREEYIQDLDSLPFPDYGLIRFDRYWGEKRHSQMNGVLADKKYTHIISTRACPFNCIYCHSIFGKKLRKRSPENFVNEIKWLNSTYGVREFHIVDDIFNFDRERMHTILNMIIDSGLKIKMAFPNALRADMLEKEDLALLKKAGVYMVTFAIETASPRIQKIIRKNLDIDKVTENINYAESIGLLVKGFFMLGFPGETLEEIEQTINFAVKSKLDLAHFFTVTPFPGTALRQLAKETYPEWQDEAMYHYWPDKPFYQQATGFDLNRVQKKAYLKFYVSPRMIKTFYKIPLKLMRMKKWTIFAAEVLGK